MSGECEVVLAFGSECEAEHCYGFFRDGGWDVPDAVAPGGAVVLLQGELSCVTLLLGAA